MKIYVTACPLNSGSGAVRGSRRGDVLGSALAEDGTGLVQHLSSSVECAKHDMGLTSEWQHDRYREHAPEGYEVEWVDDPATHAGWQAALAINRKEEAERIAGGSPEASRPRGNP